MPHIMHRALLLSLAALTASLAAGCAPVQPGAETTEEDTDETESAIIGGMTSVTRKRVVSIQVPKAGGGSKHWCTGYVVGSRAVITAAHCLCEPGVTKDDFTFHNRVHAADTDPMTKKGTTEVLKVESTLLMNDTCAKGWAGADVALLVLNKPVNIPGIKPGFNTPFFSFPKNPGTQDFHAFGYGRTVYNQPSPATRKRVLVRFDENKAGQPAGFETEPYKKDDEWQGTLCHGDSGAPLFINGDQFVAVHSSGDAFCSNNHLGYHRNTRLISSDQRMEKIIRKIEDLAYDEVKDNDLRRKLRPDCEGDGTFSGTVVEAVSTIHANELYDCPDGSNPEAWKDDGPVGPCIGCGGDDEDG